MKLIKSPVKGKDNSILVTGLCFLMIFTCLGFCSSNKGMYLTAITEALHLPRGLFSLNDTCRYMAAAAANMLFGTLILRCGARKLIAAGFAFLIGSVLIQSFAESLFLFYLAGLMLGIGTAWTTTSMVGYVVGRRCAPEKRGEIMGFVLSANGVGGALAAQLIAPFVYSESDPFGYRIAYRMVAGILLVAGTLIVCLLHDKETPEEREPVRKKKRGRSWEGIPFADIVHQPFFYVVLAGVCFTGMLLQGISSCAAAHLKDVGMSASLIANVMSLHAIFLTLFKFIAGVAYDKIGLRRTIFGCQIGAVVACFLLAFANPSTNGVAFAWGFALFVSIGLPLETIMLPLIVSDLFGENSYEKLLGIILCATNIGFAVGGPIINTVYDFAGSYVPVLIAGGLLLFMVALAFQRALRCGEKVRTERENMIRGEMR